MIMVVQMSTSDRPSSNSYDRYARPKFVLSKLTGRHCLVGKGFGAMAAPARASRLQSGWVD